MWRRFFFSFIFLAAVAVLLHFWTPVRLPTWPGFSAPVVDAQSQQLAAGALSRLRIVEARQRVLGYERQKFGGGWAQVVAPDGNYCSTRELVLNLDFPTEEAGACPAAVGTAIDEYSGEAITPEGTDIDHIFPLSAAWDLGAYSWDSTKRKSFANDWRLNLAITAAELNREKSDSTLEGWLPPLAEARCPYVARYLAVAKAYDLAITVGDEQAARVACRVVG